MIARLHPEYEFLVVTRDTDYKETEPYPDIVSDTWIERDDCKVWYFSRQSLNRANLNAVRTLGTLLAFYSYMGRVSITSKIRSAPAKARDIWSLTWPNHSSGPYTSHI